MHQKGLENENRKLIIAEKMIGLPSNKTVLEPGRNYLYEIEIYYSRNLNADKTTSSINHQKKKALLIIYNDSLVLTSVGGKHFKFIAWIDVSSIVFSETEDDDDGNKTILNFITFPPDEDKSLNSNSTKNEIEKNNKMNRRSSFGSSIKRRFSFAGNSNDRLVLF